MFRSRLSAAAFVRKTRLIIGLDLAANITGKSGIDLRAETDRVEQKALQVIAQTADYAVAFKVNHHLVLPLGLFDRVQRIVRAIHDQGLPAIMDCKINDIGDTNQWIARYYFDAGFDAVIANPLVGWKGGLDSVFQEARERSRGVILLCYMSHPASDEGYGLWVASERKQKEHEPLYLRFARLAKQWDVDGVIVGATYPDKIREVRDAVGNEIPILSPGVGAQGGSAREAINAGASFIIASRSIVSSPDPAAAARTLAEETR
ncbi:MAG: orotidine 5'-phosphate decarboxylase [Candidatus Thorarchaeota archaeon]